MYKIYSRTRIKIPNKLRNLRNIKNRKRITILVILIIAICTAKLILDSVLPIFDVLCENRAKSIATIISNEQATLVMQKYSYNDMFIIEKDSEQNINMIRSNVIVINEIISDVAVKIQEEINKRGRENIQIALRKFYRF